MSSQTPNYVSPSSYDHINDDDIHELAFAKRGRCCVWLHACFNTDPVPSSSGVVGSDFWHRLIKPVDCTRNYPEESWWFEGWMKFRDWSELVAGPRWKTFLRRFNNKKPVVNGKFQYDPSSYALNFDRGSRRLEDDDLLGRGFSSRYSLPPSCKSSIDFDKEGLVT